MPPILPLLMRAIQLLIVLAMTPAAGATAAQAGQVGFDSVQVSDRGGAPLQVGIWYPTSAAPSAHRLELFTQDVAADGSPVEAANGALVVMSHGTGGSLGGHYDTALALAQAGFIVAAPTHTGDNYRDQTAALRMQDRSPQISSTIDFVLRAWRGHGAVDPARIGMFGFSSGGFTTLVSIGGRPDFSRIGPYCAAHPHIFSCSLMARHGLAQVPVVPASAWQRDARIRSAVIAAPALGFTFTRPGLSGVVAPVQLWAAADDHILPVPDNAGAVDAALPRPAEYHLVAGADHFDFLAPCSVALAQAAPPICAEPAGFDRTAFHRQFDAAIVRFFTRTLLH